MPRVLQNLSFMVKRSYQKRAFKPYQIHRDISGMPFDFYIADPVAKEWYDNGSSKWPEMDFLKDNLIKPGEVILECGAHQGFTTSYIATCAGKKGHVVAFEPSPFNVEIIKKNLELNHLTNTEVVASAIGSAVGKAQFSFVSNGSIQSSSVGTFAIDVTTIDSYAHLKPTMLKIDVEGYDVHALRGAKKVLKTRPKIALEIHYQQLPEFGHSVKDVFDLLDLSNYKCTLLTPTGFKPLGKIEDIKTNVHLFAVPK